MNKNIKILMVILIILIIIITIVLAILLKKQEKNIFENEQEEQLSTEEYISNKNELSKVQEKYEYFDIQTCVNNYIKTLKSLNKNLYEEYTTDEESKQEMEEYIKNQEQVLYNQLGDEYIQEFNITLDNISNYFSKYYKINIFNIQNMRGIDINNDLSFYVIDGEIVYNNNLTEQYEFIIKNYPANLTYSVYPYEYIEKVGGLEETLQNLNKSKYQTIENKYDNSYVSNAYNDEYICKYYFSDFKNNIIVNTNYIYNKLDEEYKYKRFGSIEEFKKYIEEKQIQNINIVLKEYLVEENKDKTLNYVCKDQYGDLYIFKQDVIGNYTLTLDTYTLDQQKFNTEYAKANDQKKVMMNIDKFFQMINAKDYKAAYNCLSNSFKNNYFKTEQSFETFAKLNFYNYNDVSYNTFNSTSSGVYGYELTLKDRQNTSNSKIFNIVMKLNNGTDFEMSFEI